MIEDESVLSRVQEELLACQLETLFRDGPLPEPERQGDTTIYRFTWPAEIIVYAELVTVIQSVGNPDYALLSLVQEDGTPLGEGRHSIVLESSEDDGTITFDTVGDWDACSEVMAAAREEAENDLKTEVLQ